MNVICHGDSNTYGYDPRSYFGGRYDADSRWVDILAEKTGWIIKNEGMNGRGIPHSAPIIPLNTDLLIVMLGTNDLLQGDSAGTVSERMEHFLNGLDLDDQKLILIAPPLMQMGEWVADKDLIEKSMRLAAHYRTLAENRRIRCFDAGEWDIPMAYDGVHFTEEGHRRFANGLWEEIAK